MLRYREVQKIEQEIVSITCDICGKVYDADDFEIQEFHHINFCGGYGSVFGDGVVLETDLCTTCQNEIFGNYLKLKEE